MERLRPGDPEQIGPWQIVNRLGAGGMGIVYMGNNGTRAAAVKIVREFLLEDPSSRARLSREVAILKKIKGKFVAEIVGADIDSNPAWIATNYVDGPSLKTLVDNEGPLSEQKWLELAYGLMSALNAVHNAGVIHRDVKPSNILMSATGPKLIDFGISFSSDATSLTRTGMVAGTPAWFSPEQFEGTKITGAVDNFAAGTVLYFAATGTNPWGKDDTSVANTMHMILNKDADFSLLTEIQKEIISLLHKKSPKERSTASEILSRLEERGTSFSGSHIGETTSASGISKQKKIVIGAGMALTVLAGVAFMQIKPFSSDTVGVVSPTPTPAKEIQWSVQIVGDAKPKEGVGSKFSTFICDQGVVNESLQLRELTNPVAKKQPTLKLLTGDARCGKDFDTILIEGEVDETKRKRDYILAGSTKTGFIIQYEFSISVKN
jgi:serine/threonine protein kinase